MKQIRIVDGDGKTIRYAYLEHESLKFEFEFYAPHEDEGDYEIIQTVAPAEFKFIATMFGLNPMQDILSLVQEISDSGRGRELIDALNSKEIKNKLHKWGRFISFRDQEPKS